MFKRVLNYFCNANLERFGKRLGPRTLSCRPEKKSNIASKNSYNILRFEKLIIPSRSLKNISLQAAGQTASGAIKICVEQTWQPENALTPSFSATFTQAHKPHRHPGWRRHNFYVSSANVHTSQRFNAAFVQVIENQIGEYFSVISEDESDK